MRNERALRRYLARHSEADLPDIQATAPVWNQVLVIPVYRESPELLQQLAEQQFNDAEPLLVILVINRPDDNPDSTANQPLRDRAQSLPMQDSINTEEVIHRLNANTDLLLYDMELRRGACPAHQGVGLARKLGCDIALAWKDSGAIASDWLCCTDADAQLPPDYFNRLAALPHNSSAAVFPFLHEPADNPALTQASNLYELRLHQYVAGLDYADSHYAMHTLGSCMAIKASAYAHVQGVPRRNAAEDFYLLNKLAKVGDVIRLDGKCIRLASRASDRVPFGTGPALANIAQLPDPMAATLFYDPQCFQALKAVLERLHHTFAGNEKLPLAFAAQELPEWLAREANKALASMGLQDAIEHCQRQSTSQQQFNQHMRQWFDGFRTLKFIHYLRDNALPLLSLDALDKKEPTLWALQKMDASDTLTERIQQMRQHWLWLP